MKAPLTIIVPVRNRAQVVTKTLDSIAASSCAFEELLIVDNGSGDATAAVCRQWVEAHQDIPARMMTEPRPGAAVARNCGLRACQSEYVYFFDSDDVFSDNFIEDIYPEFAEPFDVLCVPVRQEVDGVVRERPYRACADVYVHLINNMLSTQSMVYSKAFLEAAGGWNEELTTWDDWELGTRVLLAHPRLRWHEGQAFHRVLVHRDSLTGPSFTATLPAIGKATQAVLQALQQKPMAETERRCALKAFYLRCMIYGGQLRCEGSREGEATFKALAKEAVGKPKCGLRWTGGLLRRYAARGGRGAWRIAMAVVDLSSCRHG